MDNNILTQNGIPELFKYMKNEKKDEILNLTVQISSCKTQESSSKLMYKCVINDHQFKLNAVFIFSENFGKLDNYDIVRIIQTFSAGASGKANFIIVKKYEIISKNNQVIDETSLPFYSEEIAQSLNKPNNNYNKDYNNNNNYNNYQETNNSNNYQRRDHDNHPSNINHISSDSNYTKLNHLTTFTKEINIRVRLTKKFEKKSFNGNNKPGCVFSFNIMDDEGTEMACCGFNKTVELFYDKLQENKVYEFSGGYVKINDKKYSNIKSEYKYFLDERTVINLVDDDGTILKTKFNYVKVDKINDLPVNSTIDLLAVVLEIGEVQTIKTKKNNEDRQLKKITVGDDSQFKIEVAIWGKNVDYHFNKGDIYCFKNIRITEFKGRNLTLGDDSSILNDATTATKDAVDIKFTCDGFNGEFKPIPQTGQERDENSAYSNQNVAFIKDMSEILDSNESENTKNPNYKIKGIVVNFNHTDRCYYVGCPECKKKLKQEGETECGSCHKKIDKPSYYYTLNVKIKDATGEIYADIIGNVGQKLIGISCEEYKDYVVYKDEAKLKEISSMLEFKTFYFIINPRINIYNDVRRKRYSVLRIDNFDSLQETKRIIKSLVHLTV